MVDVGSKPVSARVARARSRLRAQPSTIRAIETQTVKKGDVLAVARVAGIMAAKRTSELIPLCHPIPISAVTVTMETHDTAVEITAEAKTEAQTGVEMEALTAVSVAALTVYDMCKSLDRGMTIECTELISKSGGVHGDWIRPEEPA